jgi:hypothetical protein
MILRLIVSPLDGGLEPAQGFSLAECKSPLKNASPSSRPSHTPETRML